MPAVISLTDYLHFSPPASTGDETTETFFNAIGRVVDNGSSRPSLPAHTSSKRDSRATGVCEARSGPALVLLEGRRLDRIHEVSLNSPFISIIFANLGFAKAKT